MNLSAHPEQENNPKPMADPAVREINGSEARELSDDEKHSEKIGVDTSDLPPDPDAGLSEEERAKAVSISHYHPQEIPFPYSSFTLICWCLMLTAIPGPKAALEARLEADPVALPVVPGQVSTVFTFGALPDII